MIMAQASNDIVRGRDVMNTRIISIDGMATAKEAAAQMKEERVRSLLVNKRHADDAWGIVSVQDIIRGVLIPGKQADEVNVYEIMTKPIVSVPADMDIRYIARLLYRIGMRRAPVEENGQLVGMVTLSSLVLDNDLFLR